MALFPSSTHLWASILVDRDIRKPVSGKGLYRHRKKDTCVSTCPRTRKIGPEIHEGTEKTTLARRGGKKKKKGSHAVYSDGPRDGIRTLLGGDARHRRLRGHARDRQRDFPGQVPQEIEKKIAKRPGGASPGRPLGGGCWGGGVVGCQKKKR